MSRRGLPFLIAFVALAAWLAPIGPAVPRAVALPVATSNSTYSLYGRVFPDPQGCTKGTPTNSPWAKGNVCAATFLQFDETIAGLTYLQSKYPRYAHLVDLHELKATVPEFADLDMMTAGLPKEDLSRDRKHLYVFVVTDRDSTVPLADRNRYAYSLSIHGIERAGLEGGVRAAEDLITWAATAPNTHILEPTNSGPTAGDVLKNDVLYFVLSNPDGWSRGDLTKAGVYYQRYNGDGVDLNREWPGAGFSNPTYTPFTEPEAKGYGAYLKRERAVNKNAPFVGVLDLHGMEGAPSFSYTMLPGGGRNFASNAHVVDVARTVYADATKRLAYSPLIAPPEKCPGPIPVELIVSSGTLPMCADQWGTVWDTIDYQTTGSIGAWMGSALGLGAIGVDNEMAYSHLFPDSVFIPALEQVHVDANKGIIFGQLAALTNPAPTPAFNVTAAYAPSVNRKVRTATSASALAPLLVQAPLELLPVLAQGSEFIVKGPDDGVRNGGLTLEFTGTNVHGILVEPLRMTVQRYGPQHPGDADGWHDVGRVFVQETQYLAAGGRIDLNDPQPGRWRIKPSSNILPVKARISFTASKAVPQPDVPYNVANTDVFKDLSDLIKPITPAAILANPKVLDSIGSYVLADDPAPGVAPADLPRWYAALKTYASNGGNLVLTDHALDALVPLGVVPATALTKGKEYGGWISFTDAADETTFKASPLTAGLDLPGAAAGSGAGLDVRRQTYDPGALGYYIGESANGDCTAARCDAPQEIVDTGAWTKAGGTVAGRTAVQVSPDANTEPIGVAYGELPVGTGRIRIAGGLLPPPTEANNHTYGLEAHGLSWTGWQVLVNLLSVGVAKPVPATSVLGITLLPRTGGQSRIPLDVAALAVVVAALVRLVRARRRLLVIS